MKKLEEFYSRSAAPWGTSVTVSEDRGYLTLEIRTGNVTVSHALTKATAEALGEALTRAKDHAYSRDGGVDYTVIDGVEVPSAMYTSLGSAGDDEAVGE